MYVEFTADIPGIAGLTKGSIHEMSDGVGRAYVNASQAVESSAGAHARASVKAEMDAFKAEMLETVRAGFQAPANQQQQERKPPGSGAGFEVGDRLEGAGKIEPAKLKRHERNFHAGQMVRALFGAQARDSSPEDREWGSSLLRKLYCEPERINYKVHDGDDQKSAQRFSDDMSVARTGAESVSGGPSYGFLVRPEWSDTLFRIPIEESVIEPFAFDIPVNQTLEFKMPALDQYGVPTAGQSSSYAGFQISRRGEITQRQYSDGKTNEIDYKVTDLTAFTTYSLDLDADAYIRMGALFQQVLGQGFMWKKDYEYLNGNGAGMPQGILNGGIGVWGATLYNNLPPSVLTVDRNTANTILYEDLVAMMQQIHPAYWREMYWITNSAQTLSQLVSIKNAAGNLVYQPNSLIGQSMTPTVMGDGSPYSNLTWTAQGTLEGKPVRFTEKLPQLGSTGDLILCNPRYAYGIATRTGLEMSMSDHFLFDTDRRAIRWKLRNDARPLLRKAFTQSDGGITSGNSTVSWCSVLAAHH